MPAISTALNTLGAKLQFPISNIKLGTILSPEKIDLTLGTTLSSTFNTSINSVNKELDKLDEKNLLKPLDIKIKSNIEDVKSNFESLKGKLNLNSIISASAKFLTSKDEAKSESKESSLINQEIGGLFTAVTKAISGNKGVEDSGSLKLDEMLGAKILAEVTNFAQNLKDTGSNIVSQGLSIVGKFANVGSLQGLFSSTNGVLKSVTDFGSNVVSQGLSVVGKFANVGSLQGLFSSTSGVLKSVTDFGSNVVSQGLSVVGKFANVDSLQGAFSATSGVLKSVTDFGSNVVSQGLSAVKQFTTPDFLKSKAQSMLSFNLLGKGSLSDKAKNFDGKNELSLDKLFSFKGIKSIFKSGSEETYIKSAIEAKDKFNKPEKAIAKSTNISEGLSEKISSTKESVTNNLSIEKTISDVVQLAKIKSSSGLGALSDSKEKAGSINSLQSESTLVQNSMQTNNSASQPTAVNISFNGGINLANSKGEVDVSALKNLIIAELQKTEWLNKSREFA